MQQFLDNNNLSQSVSSQRKLLSRSLIKRVETNSPSSLKDSLQKIIHLYLSHINQELQPEEISNLQGLEEEIKIKSFYEIRSKYLALTSLGRIEKIKDPLYLMILQCLLSPQINKAIQQEIESLAKEVAEHQMEWAPVYRDEMLRLAIRANQEKRMQQGKEFNCYVLDHRELPHWLELIELYAMQKGSGRFFLLVRNNVHYTALDCHIQGKERSCLILDASQDPKHKILEKQLLTKGFTIAIAGEGEEDKIQADTRSCSIFSLTQLMHTSKDAFYFEKVTKNKNFNAKTKRIAWAALDLGLIKNCQDLLLLSQCQKLHSETVSKSNKEINYYKCLDRRINLNRFVETEKNTALLRNSLLVDFEIGCK